MPKEFTFILGIIFLLIPVIIVIRSNIKKKKKGK